jgi:hypothetical protein
VRELLTAIGSLMVSRLPIELGAEGTGPGADTFGTITATLGPLIGSKGSTSGSLVAVGDDDPEAGIGVGSTPEPTAERFV